MDSSTDPRLVNEPEAFITGDTSPAELPEPDEGSRAWFTRIGRQRGRHPSTIHVLRYLAWAHLAPGPLRDTSKLFGELGVTLIDRLPDGPELTAGLRKLVESKDCAVRAQVDVLAGD